MHQWTYAICSWIIKKNVCCRNTPSRVTILVKPREHHKDIHLETRTYTEPAVWNPLQEILKHRHSSGITVVYTVKTQNKMLNISIQIYTINKRNWYIQQVLTHTFLWHTRIPGVVSLLRRLIAYCIATLGPPQDTERPVQPPERAAPHWRTIKVSDCKGEREALYSLPDPQHAQTCLKAASSQPIRFLLRVLSDNVGVLLWATARRWNTCMSQEVHFE